MIFVFNLKYVIIIIMRKINDSFAKEFDEKCARVNAHGFLKFISDTDKYDMSILDVLAELSKVIVVKPYEERRDGGRITPYDEGQFNDIINQFFEKYFPSKATEVAQILNGTNPYFLDEEGKSHINFLPPEKGKSSSVGHSGHNSYLEFNVYKNGDVFDLVTTAHEISHAISGHHKRIIDCIREGGSQEQFDSLTRNRGFGKDCVGEIESLIVERLFNQFLVDKGLLGEEDLRNYYNLQNSSLLCEINLLREESDVLKQLPCPVTKESLQKLTERLEKKGQTRLLERIEKMHDDDKSSPFMFRYIVGRIVADLWMEEFLKTDEKEDKLKKFCLYLENNEKLDLDDTCDYLLEIDAASAIFSYYLKCEDEREADEEMDLE